MVAVNDPRVNNGCSIVILPRTMFSRGRIVRWKWTDCAGGERYAGPWIDAKGHILYLGDPPQACTSGPDFDCPIHPRHRALAL